MSNSTESPETRDPRTGAGRTDPVTTECDCGADHRSLIESYTSRDDDGCWQWLGRTDRDGYGLIGHNSFDWFAHRLSYVAFVSAIPTGLVIDHLCRNRGCVNPDHLEPVTNRENIIRGLARAGRNARKTVCKRGHSLTDPQNVVIRHRGNGIERRCLECRRIVAHERYVRVTASRHVDGGR